MFSFLFLSFVFLVARAQDQVEDGEQFGGYGGGIGKGFHGGYGRGIGGAFGGGHGGYNKDYYGSFNDDILKWVYSNIKPYKPHEREFYNPWAGTLTKHVAPEKYILNPAIRHHIKQPVFVHQPYDIKIQPVKNIKVTKTVEELPAIVHKQKVEQFKHLMKMVFEDGYKSGYMMGGGFKKGIGYEKEIGLEKGFEKGIGAGFEKGVEGGFQKGVEGGLEKGVEKGFEKGVEKGIEQGGYGEEAAESRRARRAPSQSYRTN